MFPRRTGRRCAPAERSRPCEGSASGSNRARCSRFWAPTGPARRPCSRFSSACAVPSAGRVLRLGQPLSERGTLGAGRLHARKPGVSPLPDRRQLLEFYGDLSGIPPSVLRIRVPALLERVGLADRAREPIARFSKGMVQRLALAQGLLAEPDLLVLDEPMEGLDLTARLLLQEIVVEQRKAGKTVLIVSHALGEVTQVCDRLAVLVEGRLAYLGSLASLLRSPGTGRERSLEAALEPIYRS